MQLEKHINITKTPNGAIVSFGGQVCLTISEMGTEFFWSASPVFAKLTYGASTFSDLPRSWTGHSTMAEAIADGLNKLDEMKAFYGIVDLADDTYGDKLNESEELDEDTYKDKSNSAWEKVHAKSKGPVDRFITRVAARVLDKTKIDRKTGKVVQSEEVVELEFDQAAIVEALASIKEDCRVEALRMSDSLLEAQQLANELFEDITEEYLNELSKATLGSYAKKAATDAAYKELNAGQMGINRAGGFGYAADKKAKKRLQGVHTAVNKLTEVEELDEVWAGPNPDKQPKSYVAKLKAKNTGKQAPATDIKFDDHEKLGVWKRNAGQGEMILRKHKKTGQHEIVANNDQFSHVAYPDSEAAGKKYLNLLGKLQEEELDEYFVPYLLKGKQKPYVSSLGPGHYEVLGNVGQVKATFTRATHGKDAHAMAQKHLRAKYNEYMAEEVEVLDEARFGMDDIAVGGTVIYKTLKGDHKMSKVRNKGNGFALHLQDGSTIQNHAVRSTDASDWKHFENLKEEVLDEKLDRHGDFHRSVENGIFAHSKHLDTTKKYLHDKDTRGSDGLSMQLATFDHEKHAQAAAKKHGGRVERTDFGTYRVTEEVLDEATRPLSGDAYWKSKEVESKEEYLKAQRKALGLPEPVKRGRGKPTNIDRDLLKTRAHSNVEAGKRPTAGFDRNEKIHFVRHLKDHPDFAEKHVSQAGRPVGTTKVASQQQALVKKKQDTAFSMWAGLGKK